MTRERDPEPDVAPEFDEGLRHLDELLQRLYGPLGGDLGPANLDAGVCAECGLEVRRRWRYGPLALCRTCARRHVRAAAQVGVEPPMDDPLEELAERARAVLAEHTADRERDVGTPSAVTSAATGHSTGDLVRPAAPTETRRFVP